MDSPDLKDNQVISYLYLRMLIGACGFVLPLLCLIYGMIYGIQDSISDYYYTSLRNVFEGILFVLGFFLLTYLLLTEGRRAAWNTTFWFESVALVAFSISWLTKGHFYQESFKLFGKVRTLLVRSSSPTGS